MRWVVFCWSESDVLPELLRPDDVIVCADSGLDYARRCGVEPQIVLGDFDSYAGTLPQAEILSLPAEKDDTDTMYAVRLGLERGIREFLIAGGIGGRLDHTVGALQTLNFLSSHGATATLSDGKQWATVLSAPIERSFVRAGEKYVSLLSLTPECTGVTLDGFRYPLNGARLVYDFPLGVSNEPTGTDFRIALSEGRLLVIGVRG